MPSNVAPSPGGIWAKPKSDSWFHVTNSIPIGSAVLAQFMLLTNRKTDRHVNESATGLSLSPHREHGTRCRHSWSCCDRPLLSVINWKYFCSSLPSVLWRCWLGDRKGIRPVKNWALGCWHGYWSGARCRVAYGPADATATHSLLLQWNPDWFCLSGTGPPGYG